MPEYATWAQNYFSNVALSANWTWSQGQWSWISFCCHRCCFCTVYSLFTNLKMFYRKLRPIFFISPPPPKKKKKNMGAGMEGGIYWNHSVHLSVVLSMCPIVSAQYLLNCSAIIFYQTSYGGVLLWGSVSCRKIGSLFPKVTTMAYIIKI